MHLSHPLAIPQTKTCHTFSFFFFFLFFLSNLVIRYISNIFFTNVVYLIFKIALGNKMSQWKVCFSKLLLIFRNKTAY